jgi:hypothetical protein
MRSLVYFYWGVWVRISMQFTRSHYLLKNH